LILYFKALFLATIEKSFLMRGKEFQQNRNLFGTKVVAVKITQTNGLSQFYDDFFPICILLL
jgi:hypothetical protein